MDERKTTRNRKNGSKSFLRKLPRIIIIVKRGFMDKEKKKNLKKKFVGNISCLSKRIKEIDRNKIRNF